MIKSKNDVDNESFEGCDSRLKYELFDVALSFAFLSLRQIRALTQFKFKYLITTLKNFIINIILGFDH